jgi:hypothetical protein
MLTASALRLAGAGLPPLGSEFAWSVDPFGFSRRIAVSLGKLVSDLLDWLGFPWILSSESRLFSGLHETTNENFSGAFAAGVGVVTMGDSGICGLGLRKGEFGHQARLA